MATNKKRVNTKEKERDVVAFNPTKSRFGRIIILILALGMFLGLLVAAIMGGIAIFRP